MSDHSELWDVVDELRTRAKPPHNEAFCIGMGAAADKLEAALNRLNIPRKRVCGECEWSEDYAINTILCQYPVDEKMPITIEWTSHAVERDRNASNCPCFKEAP